MPEEIPELARLWHAGWQDAHAEIVPAELLPHRTLASFETRLDRAINRGSQPVRAIGPPGAPIGFWMQKDEELNQFYVSAEARGTGAAAHMMDDAISRLRETVKGPAWLACAIGNDRAARFYEKTGWRRSGTMIDLLETPAGPISLDVWRYEYDLTAANA